MNATQIVCPGCGATNRVPRDRPAAAAKCGNCHDRLFNLEPLEVDEADFQRHLRGNSIPLLIDVWAPWCSPCRLMAPHFARAATELEPDVRLLKLDADTAPNVSAQLGVRGIPAMYLFREGRVVAQTTGAMTTDAIVRWTRQHLALLPS